MMDALGFTRELKRMCTFYYDTEKGYCSDNCPARNLDCMSLDQPEEDIERIVEVVKLWSQENPRKTRQDLVLEQWPNAQVDNQGILFIYPCELDKTMHKKDEPCCKGCEECRAEFWGQGVN